MDKQTAKRAVLLWVAGMLEHGDGASVSFPDSLPERDRDLIDDAALQLKDELLARIGHHGPAPLDTLEALSLAQSRPTVPCKHCGMALQAVSDKRWRWQASRGSAIFCPSHRGGDAYHEPKEL